MKIYITNHKNESFESVLTRTEQTFETYKGCYIIGMWNGFEIRGINLGYKFSIIEEAKAYIDLKNQVNAAQNSKLEWPETR